VYRSKAFIVARVLCCLFVDLIWRQLTLYSCGKGDLIQSLPREDFVINANERALTDHVPMIVDPTPDFGVELMDQIWLPCLCRAFPILVLGTGSGSKGLAVERLTK